MKIALALTLLACYLVGTAVARPRRLYHPDNLYAHLSSKRPMMQRPAAKPSSTIFEVYEQQEGPANFVFESVDDDGNTADCGCWRIAQVEGVEKKKREATDNRAAKAYIQFEVIPGTKFYEVDQYGQLSVCKCEELSGEPNEVLQDFAEQHGRWVVSWVQIHGFWNIE